MSTSFFFFFTSYLLIVWLLVLTFQLFEVSVENTEALLRYGSALVQGAGNVFWYDAFKKKKLANVLPISLG